MTNAFKKGQLVTYIAGNSHDKGDYYCRDAIVFSCGKKQMVLTDAATGQEMGRHFAPIEATGAQMESGTYKRLSPVVSNAIAFSASTMKCIQNSKKWARMVASEYGTVDGKLTAYGRVTQALIDANHQPSATTFEKLMEEAAKR